VLFTFHCNIFIGVRIFKEMPGSVASGTLYKLATKELQTQSAYFFEESQCEINENGASVDLS
jgi:hypothetical protein